jgi:hypothetical protein
MEKIQRKYMAHFMEMGDKYIRLGQDLEEYAPELSAQVEKTKNILGQTSVRVVGYEKTGSVEPYYAVAGDPLFEKLQEIIDGDLVLEACKAAVVEVKLWDGQGSTYPAIREECYIEVVSYGGDTQGYQIPFKLHYTGSKTAGTFDLETGTFTAAA